MLNYQAQSILKAIELKNTQLLSNENILFVTDQQVNSIPLCS